jgi:A/G-specific adenine glycosylase
VIAYYDRFLDRFPTLSALAKANEEDVLKCWEGLGYYRRILHLHRAACLLRDGGRTVPSTTEELRRLPGIGAYTAAAVASIAFKERVAAVDGNVARVLARAFGITEDVLSAKGKVRIAALATQLIPVKRPGDFNQAWMDLGREVCTPRSPACGRCPLESMCSAAATGRAGTLPRRGSTRQHAPRPVSSVVVVFIHKRSMLVRRRPRGGLWSGLWEFPNTEMTARSMAPRLVRRLAGREKVTVSGRLRKAGTVRHQLTHQAWTFHVFVAPATPDAGCTDGNSRRWVDPNRFRKLAVSTAHRRVYAAAEAMVAALRRDG